MKSTIRAKLATSLRLGMQQCRIQCSRLYWNLCRNSCQSMLISLWINYFDVYSAPSDVVLGHLSRNEVVAIVAASLEQHEEDIKYVRSDTQSVFMLTVMLQR